MSLEELGQIAFRQGCDIGLTFVRHTPRYRQLHQQAISLGMPEPHRSALVASLGERLAKRAFQNLPQAIRQFARKWRTMGVEEQKAALEYICRTLRSSRWQRTRYALGSYNTDLRSVLPHSFQSWQRGRVKPNCLGVAHMMVGFAQEAGAPHYLANFIRTFQQELLSWEVYYLKSVISVVDSFPSRNHHMQEVTAKLRKGYETALIRTSQQQYTPAHHGIVLQIADGSWWVVDPYLGALYCLGDDPERDVTMAQLATQRNHTMLVPRQEVTLPYMYELDCKLQALRFMYRLMQRRFGSDRQLTGVILRELADTVAYTALYEPTSYEEDFGKKLARLHANREVRPGSSEWQLAGAILNRAIMPQPNKEALSIAARAEKDEMLHQRLAWRLVASHLWTFIKDIDDLYSNREMHEHVGFELAWPAQMLGVATLNHLRLHIPTPLGGVLSVLSQSQWVLADDLAAEQEGDEIAPRYRESIDSQLAALQNLDPRLLILPFASRRLKPPHQTGGNSS